MFGWIASAFHGTNMMSYNSQNLLEALRSDDFSGQHLDLLPDGHSGRTQVADDMSAGISAIMKFKRNLLQAPHGTVSYVARTFQHPGGWSVHAAVAFTSSHTGEIWLWDLDGAEGEDWTDGPSSFRNSIEFEEFFKGCLKAGDDDFMSFDQEEHFCIFVPIATSSYRQVNGIAQNLQRNPHFARYHYLKCNCQTYAVWIIADLCNGMPEFLALVLQKIIPSVHSSVAGAGGVADWTATVGMGLVVAVPLVGIPFLPLIASAVGAGAGGGAVVDEVTDRINQDALPERTRRIVKLRPMAFQTFTLQCD